MSTQITLTIPDDIYQQVEYVAQTTNRLITEVLAETIRLALPRLHTNKNRATMQSEASAFEAIHPVLWEQYPHQYVAMHQKIVIDHDIDQLALVERINELYSNQVVLIRQVLPNLPKPLVFHSPHFIT